MKWEKREEEETGRKENENQCSEGMMGAAGRAQLLQMLFCREADKTSRVEGKHNQEPLVLLGSHGSLLRE